MAKDYKNTFIYRAHCEGTNPSSKRLWGGIGFGFVQLCILAATILSLCLTYELSSAVKDLLEFDMITSAALLGLSTITGAFGGNKKLAIGGKEEESSDSESEEENEEEKN